MVTWSQFAGEAPRIAEIFVRRHTATGNLCFLGTLRSDGYPRISPIEPRIFEDQLTLVGMPNTTKFSDLERDARLCLHTATTDPHLGDGDVKLWADAVNYRDRDFHGRFADELFQTSGLDLRGQEFDPFFVADISGASSIELVDNQLEITIWRPGEGERVVVKKE